MVRVHDAFHDLDCHARLLARLAALVLDPNPLAVADAVFLRVVGMDEKLWIGMHGTQAGNLAMFGMEEFDVACARGEHQRVFFEELRRADRTVGRLLVVRQRLVAERLESDGI